MPRERKKGSGPFFVFGLCVLLHAGAAWAQLPGTVTLDEVLRIVEQSPRVAVSLREADMARAERAQAGALPNPNLSLGRFNASSGERTIFGADSQQQAQVELPVPVFGQRGARVRAADFAVGRAQSQVRLTLAETRRLAALAFARLLGAGERLAARRAALSDVERIRGLVAGRADSGMASRYDLARADAELALARIGAQKSDTEVNEQAAALAGLVDAPGWRPRAEGSLAALQEQLRSVEAQDPSSLLAANPSLELARAESEAAQARVELAHRERYPVPSVSLGRTWTSGPFGAANFIGLSSEIPILDTRKALEDRANAEAAAARERERASGAALRAEVVKQQATLAALREALERFEQEAGARQGAFLEMAESAYRLGRGSLFELLDARRTQLDTTLARLDLVSALVEAQLELRSLSGSL
jgi:cobalt-zinc-cadmium efflux system outer membrane protein